MRLSKFLATAGVASRRRSEELIFNNKVKVNGIIANSPAMKVEPNHDEIVVCGRKINKPKPYIYILLYKPSGYISTVKDSWNRPTIMNLVKGITGRVYPVGRLDRDTEGVLMLTNDGEITYRLTHPSFEVKKVYQVKVKGIPSVKTLNRIQQGVYLEDGLTAPAKVKLLEKRGKTCVLEIIIHEGRKRQIKRLFSTLGYPVIHLKRVRFATLDLKGLKPGEYRYLNDYEINRLRCLVNLI